MYEEINVGPTARAAYGRCVEGVVRLLLDESRRDLLEEFDRAFGTGPAAGPTGSASLAEVVVDPFSTDKALVVEDVERLPIELVGGGTAWVSPEDHDLVKGHRWYQALNGRKGIGNKIYAYRQEYRDDRTREKIYLHREILGLKPRDKMSVDHVDGNTLDCTRPNMRVATSGQNARNRRKQSCYRGRSTSSKFKGVSWSRRDQRWIARVWADGRQHFLGSFRDEYDAAKAYDARALDLHGEFASTNASARPELLSDLRGRRA